MQRIQNYRDLDAWRQAIELAPLVYRMLRKLPKEETFALAAQIRRAVVSVPANIAEGHARQYTREFLQYLAISRGVVLRNLSHCSSSDGNSSISAMRTCNP